MEHYRRERCWWMRRNETTADVTEQEEVWRWWRGGGFKHTCHRLMSSEKKDCKPKEQMKGLRRLSLSPRALCPLSVVVLCFVFFKYNQHLIRLFHGVKLLAETFSDILAFSLCVFFLPFHHLAGVGIFPTIQKCFHEAESCPSSSTLLLDASKADMKRMTSRRRALSPVYCTVPSSDRWGQCGAVLHHHAVIYIQKPLRTWGRFSALDWNLLWSESDLFVTFTFHIFLMVYRRSFKPLQTPPPKINLSKEDLILFMKYFFYSF